MPLAGHPGSIERTCWACPGHRRRRVQKLTGPGGCPTKVPFFFGWGEAAQSDAQQTRRAPEAHHFMEAIAGRRGRAISGIRRVLVLRDVWSRRCKPKRSVLPDGPSVPRLLRCARNDEYVVVDVKMGRSTNEGTIFLAAPLVLIHGGGPEAIRVASHRLQARRGNL
jgi:hypothetical protein